MLRVAFAAVAVISGSSAALAQGSPARQNQEIFDVSNRESDYFEHTFRAHTGIDSAGYDNALRVASCAARMDVNGAKAVLSSSAGSAAEQKSIRELLRKTKTCVVRRDTLAPLLVRGALAETLWKQAGANPNPTRRSQVAIEDVEDFIKLEPLGERGVKAGGLAISWVARCQVMALPAEAAKVLSAAPGSKEEEAAAKALYDGSTTCGVTKGLEKTPVAAVRGALADAFYQDSNRLGATASR